MAMAASTVINTAACGQSKQQVPRPVRDAPDPSNEWSRPRSDERETERLAMVARQIASRGVRDARVLRAMEHVPRHWFVPATVLPLAYADRPLPIADDQTISQPYIVALMTEALKLTRESKVLEVGTGSGYQAALLGCICQQVYSIEIIPTHNVRARKVLESLDYTNVHLRLGDGWLGWAEEAPFDKVIVTAAAKKAVPPVLIDQLIEGGRLVIPVGASIHKQRLLVYTKGKNRTIQEEDLAVRFVPLVERD